MSRIDGLVRQCLPDDYFFHRNNSESLLSKEEAAEIVKSVVQAIDEEIQRQLTELFKNFKPTTTNSK